VFIPIDASLEDQAQKLIDRVEKHIARLETADGYGKKIYQVEDDRIDMELGMSRCKVGWIGDDLDQEGTGVWLGHHEDFCPEHARLYVRALVDGLKLETPVRVTWACWFDSLKVDGFSGGGFVIAKDGFERSVNVEHELEMHTPLAGHVRPEIHYIRPEAATKIVVFEDGHWGIHATDDDGKYTEQVWIEWNDEFMSKEVAIAHVRDFAIEIGREDLAEEYLLRYM
jgi:hypothetical protein